MLCSQWQSSHRQNPNGAAVPNSTATAVTQATHCRNECSFIDNIISSLRRFVNNIFGRLTGAKRRKLRCLQRRFKFVQGIAIENVLQQRFQRNRVGLFKYSPFDFWRDILKLFPQGF